MTVTTRPLLRLGSAAMPVLAVLLVGCSRGSGSFVVSESPPPTTAAASTSSSARPSTSSTASTASTERTTTAGPTSGSPPDPCTLVTEADATEAFGEPAQAGTQGSTECWWNTDGDLKTINVIIRSDDLDAWRSGFQNSYWAKVDLGDEGYAGKAFNSVTFRKGATIYEINVLYSTVGDPEHIVQDLAGKVASRV
jgi:hypothetical protein